MVGPSLHPLEAKGSHVLAEGADTLAQEEQEDQELPHEESERHGLATTSSKNVIETTKRNIIHTFSRLILKKRQ